MSPYRTSAKPQAARRGWFRRFLVWLVGWGVVTVYGVLPDYDARGVDDDKEGRE